MPHEPDFDELLPPGMQGELKRVELEYLRRHAELATEAIAARAAATAPVAAWQHAAFSHQEALQQHAVFGSRVGAQAAGPSLRARQAMWVLLALGAAVETAFAFNGVRYGLGQYGQIDWPWQDPLSLLGAVAIAAISLAVAQSAGVSLAWAEDRGLLADPGPVDLGSTASFVAPFDADPLVGGVLASAPLEDVLHAGAAAPVATAAATGDRASERLAQVFRRARPRAAHRRAGWLLVVLGLTLWTVNGLMRAQYLDRLPAPSAPQDGGLLKTLATSGAASAPDDTAVLIIALSAMVFLGSVMIVQRMHPAAYLRARELDGRVEVTQDAATLAAAEAADPLRRVADAQATLQAHTAAARVAAASARLPHPGW